MECDNDSCLLVSERDGNFVSSHYSCFPFNSSDERLNDSGSQDQINNTYWNLTSQDYKINLRVPGNVFYYLRSNISRENSKLKKDYKYVWFPENNLKSMLSGDVAIRVTGNITRQHSSLYVGWIEYVRSDGSIDSRSMQGSLLSGYQKIQLDPIKFKDCLIEFRDHNNPKITENWDNYDVSEDQKEKISTLFSKRATYLNEIAVNMTGVKNKSYTIKDLLEFFQDENNLNTIMERFGKENIPEFIEDDDSISIQFKKFDFL